MTILGARASRAKNGGRSPLPFALLCCLLCFAFCLLTCLPPAYSQPQQPARPVPVQRPKPPIPEPTPPAGAESDESLLPGNWAPELLDAIFSSPNPAARDALLDAAFAAGPAIVPELEAALRDDRTAEFAAQSLAYLGSPKAFAILSKLVNDPRDLGLRRFYYGALGGLQDPSATKVLLDAVDQADQEPDRTITETAIIALTVRSDQSLVRELRQRQTKIKDVVLHDDVDTAVEVIEARGRYLASPRGKNSAGSVEQAVRTYFTAALDPSPAAASSKSAPQPSALGTGGADGRVGSTTNELPGTPSAGTKLAATADSLPKVHIRSLAFSPDRARVLAHVTFEDPTAIAYYDIVLEKQAALWTLASVWLGAEMEKPGAKPEEAAPSTKK